MKAVFEITTLSQDWKPPFKKAKETAERTVALEEGFEEIGTGTGKEIVFKLLAAREDKALVKFSRLFVLKSGNPWKKEVWLDIGQPYEFSFLWGDGGVTKKITLKKVMADGDN